MENELNMIVEADKAARARVELAKKRREDLTEELAVQKKQIDEAYKAQAHAAIQKAKAEEKQTLAETEASIREKEAKIAERLAEDFAQKHEAWEKNLFDAVIRTD